MKIGVVVRRFIAIMIILCLCVIPVDTEKTNAADYPEIGYELIDSEEDLLDIIEFGEPFWVLDEHYPSEWSKIFKINISDVGTLFVSDYNDKSYSYQNAYKVSVSGSSSFIKSISKDGYSRYKPFDGDVFRYEEITSYHLVPGTYYIKVEVFSSGYNPTTKEHSAYKNMIYASFVKDVDLISVNKIDYNSDYSEARITFNIDRPYIKNGAGEYWLYEGEPTEKMLYRESGILVSSSTDSYKSDTRKNELTETGISIKENGTYTLLYRVPENEFAYLFMSTTFDVDSIGGEILPEKVKLNNSTASLVKGEQLTLKATVTPSNAVDKSLTWKSSKKSVATVSKKGVVTAKGVGTCTITATTKNGKKAKCTITVTKKAVATPTPTPKPTAAPTPTPKPTAAPTPKPTATPTPAPVSNGFPYMATLDISSKGWTAYKPGTGYDMTGDAAGTIYQDASVQVLEEKDGVSKVYSYDLKKNCYISTKYLKKVEDSGIKSTFSPRQGFYYIVPECAPNSCLDVTGRSMDENANIQIWTRQEEQQSNQIFLVEPQSDGTYIFSSLASGRSIDIESGKAGNKSNLVQKSGASIKDTQKFYLMTTEGNSNYASIVSYVDTNYCIDVDSGGSADGTNVWLYQINNTSAQRFMFLSATEATKEEKINDALKQLKELDGKAWTVDRKPCTTAGNFERGHGSGEHRNCMLASVVSQNWLCEMFDWACIDGKLNNNYFPMIACDLNANGHFLTRGVLSNSWSCLAFATFAEYIVCASAYGPQNFKGVEVTYGSKFRNFYDVKDLVKPGDAVRVGGHSFIVLEMYEGYVSVLDCNWSVDSKNKNQGNSMVTVHNFSYTHKDYADQPFSVFRGEPTN